MRLQMRRAWEQTVEQIRARILWRLFPFREQKTFEQSSFSSPGTLLVKRTRLFVCLLQKIRVHRCVNAQQRLFGPLAGRLWDFILQRVREIFGILLDIERYREGDESSPFSRSLREEEVTIFRSDFRDDRRPHCLGKCFSSSDIPWTLFSWHEPSPQHPWQDDVSGKHLSKSQSPKTRVPGCWWRAVRCLDPSLGCERGCCACPPSWEARWARRSRPRSPCPTRSGGPRNGQGELIARSSVAMNGREGSPGCKEESQVNHFLLSIEQPQKIAEFWGGLKLSLNISF